MFSKLLGLLALLVILSGCTTTYSISDINNSIIYQKKLPLTAIADSYVNTPAVNVTSWELLYQNPSNTLLNYSLQNNTFNLDAVVKIPLHSSYKARDMISNFVVSTEGLIYLITNNNTLMVIDLKSQKVVSEKKLKFLKKEHVVGLAYSDDYLYVTTNTGKVSSIYKNGDEFWTVNLLYPIQSAPIISDNKIFLIANNTVYSLTITTGEVLWYYQGVQDGISYSISTAPTIQGNMVIAGLSNGSLLFLRKENGSLVWQFNELQAQTSRYDISKAIIAPPVVVNNDISKVLVSSANNNLALLNVNKLSVVWRNTNGAFINPPVVTNNNFFFIDKYLHFNRANTTNGSNTWSLILPSKELNFMQWFGPIMVNNNLLIFNYKGYIFEVSPKTGKVTNTYKLPLAWTDKLSGNFAIVNQKLLLLGLSHLYIIN